MTSNNFASPSYTNRVVLGLGEAGGQTTAHLRQGSSKPGNAVEVDSGLFIKDVKSVSVGQNEFLCSLSDKEVRLFRWSAQSPMHVDDDDEDSEADDHRSVEETRGSKDDQPQRGRIIEGARGQGRRLLPGIDATNWALEYRQYDPRQPPQQQYEAISVDGDVASDASGISDQESMEQESGTDGGGSGEDEYEGSESGEDEDEGSENSEEEDEGSENSEEEDEFDYDLYEDQDDYGDYDFDAYMDRV
ncbi:hypothetical protein BGZ73_002980 [Actinomortierella ambigua]|nr:hypothetical protein BGZ73_002980 [Actinomortierella ambigua]